MITIEKTGKPLLTVRELMFGRAYRVERAVHSDWHGLIVIGVLGGTAQIIGACEPVLAVGLDGSLWHNGDDEARFTEVDITVQVRG